MRGVWKGGGGKGAKGEWLRREVREGAKVETRLWSWRERLHRRESWSMDLFFWLEGSAGGGGIEGGGGFARK